MKSKFLSRKFIVTVISALAGIVIALVGHDEIVLSIAACAMTVLPSIAYTITEGRIDAASVRASGDAISQTLRENGQDKAADIIDNLTDVAEEVVAEPPDKADSDT